jgi:hypothetical protein
MSDDWYREAPDLPPYEDWAGNLWTWDGTCLNPVQGCEPPAWYHDLAILDLRAEYWMTVAEWQREYLGQWPT